MAQALEYDFIEKPSEDFHCPVTLEILTEPHQTLCCGNHLSQEAADRLKREGKACPMCKEPNLNTVPDKFFRRQVNQLKVRCSKKALGCNWVGELGNLEKHLSEGSINGECQYTAVACPLLCDDHIQRRWLDYHIEDCPQRPYTCKHCGHKDTYKSVTEGHWPRCEKYPLLCPNKCRERAIERQHLQEHVEEACPLQVIQCEYAYAGCKAELKRQLMAAHLDENVKRHLSMVSEVSKQVPELQCMVEQQRKQIEAMMSVMNQQHTRVEALVTALNQACPDLPKPPSPVFIPPSDIVMTDFEKHKKDDDKWFSPPFYSHIGGYKLCIVVVANGYRSGKGTHVGLGIYMMRGVYDDNLKWPFKGEVRVQLLNQRGDKGHIEKVLLELDYSRDGFDMNAYARVVGRERAEKGRGHPKLIPHYDLGYRPAEDCQYLMNDCLKFRITRIELAL